MDTQTWDYRDLLSLSNQPFLLTAWCYPKAQAPGVCNMMSCCEHHCPTWGVVLLIQLFKKLLFWKQVKVPQDKVCQERQVMQDSLWTSPGWEKLPHEIILEETEEVQLVTSSWSGGCTTSWFPSKVTTVVPKVSLGKNNNLWPKWGNNNSSLLSCSGAMRGSCRKL